MITSSSLDRIEKCPASAVIGPRIEETSEAAERGNDIHEFLRRVAKDRSPEAFAAALACVPVEYLGTCTNLDLDTALEGLC